MRLSPFAYDPLPNPVAGRAPLDVVLAANAARNPDGIAVHEPRLPFPGTWRQIDRAATAVAELFRFWRIEEDSVVGVQLGSSAETAIVCLGLWRAGLIPALLPLAWRRIETARALLSVGACAIVAATGRGGGRHADDACDIAVALENIRFVACFGEGPPDGATPLEDVIDAAFSAPDLPERPEDAADHVAVITFDANGAPAPRSHNDLVAASLMPALSARLSEEAAILSTLDLAGLAGLATGLVPWLTTGAAACFHQPSTTGAFALAARAIGATHVTLPGRAAARLVADGALEGVAPLCVTTVWRAPDGRGQAEALGLGGARIVDVTLIGELGIVAGERPSERRHAPLPLGPYGPDTLDPLIDFRVLPDGRLLIRGPACPQASFPGDHGAPQLAFAADGYIETGLAGLADRVAGRTSLGGKRRNVVQVGGLGVSPEDAEAAARAAGFSGMLSAADDALFGSRFALTLEDDAPDVSAEEAAGAVVAAGFGVALAPTVVREERMRRTG